jgi:hypothetical protein
MDKEKNLGTMNKHTKTIHVEKLYTHIVKETDHSTGSETYYPTI